MNTKTTVTKYKVISFAGYARQHDLYTRLQELARAGVELLRGVGRQRDAEALAAWMKGQGGFTRPHMPYYVTLTEREWNLLSTSVRAGQSNTNADYNWMLKYGRWVAR